MFAAHDQENLIHGRQAAAAAKPLNQSTRQLPPKTPGNKVPKTPFKLPLNDENGNGGLGGKTGLKGKGEGKNAFVTPGGKETYLNWRETSLNEGSGPINRAPLGAKTTNAKAKAFQTPAPAINGDLGKTKKASVSATKPKPKATPAKTVQVDKLEILGDEEADDVPDIEYMPPRPKDLPDLPDDHFERDLSMFKTGGPFEGAFEYFANRKGPDGLSHIEREEKREEEKWAIMEKKMMARAQRDLDMLTFPCMHTPECPGEQCKDTIESHKRAQEEYEKTIAIIDAEAAPKKLTKATSPIKATPPGSLKSKAAAAALSQPKVTTKPIKDPVKKPTAAAPKPRFGLSTAKKPAPALYPPVGNNMRHAAAVANSKSTIGRGKGRVVSSNLPSTSRPNASSNFRPQQKPTLPRTASSKQTSGFVPFEERDTALEPAQYYNRYGEPPHGSEMWAECWKAGLMKEEYSAPQSHYDMEENERRQAQESEEWLEKRIREDALEDFQLTLDLGGDEVEAV